MLPAKEHKLPKPKSPQPLNYRRYMMLPWILLTVLVMNGQSSMTTSLYANKFDCMNAGAEFNYQVKQLGGEYKGFFTCSPGLQQ